MRETVDRCEGPRSGDGEPGFRTHSRLPSFAIRTGLAAAAWREAAEEVPVAIVYDGSTHAVLMATPADLPEMGLGFSLTDGIATAAEILSLEVVAQPDGIEIRMWLKPEAGARHRERRRAMVGPTGCGLCGVESLAAATPALRTVAQAGASQAGASWTADEIMAAVAGLTRRQTLGRATRAVHAAGLWLDGRMLAVREDVGRHNALDKLAGATAGQTGMDRAIVALTSRVSVELVQKAARMGAGCIAAVSAPTALAVRTAQAAGMSMAAVVREDGFEIFAHGDRIAIGGAQALLAS